jgi:hypothetical protein
MTARGDTTVPSSVRRILVVGATGTVGRHVVEQARDLGLDLRALVRDPELTLADDLRPLSEQLLEPAFGGARTAGGGLHATQLAVVVPETSRSSSAGVRQCLEIGVRGLATSAHPPLGPCPGSLSRWRTSHARTSEVAKRTRPPVLMAQGPFPSVRQSRMVVTGTWR